MMVYRRGILTAFNLILAVGIPHSPDGMTIYKPISQPHTISCRCENASMGQWYYDNQQPVPDAWVQANGDIQLPADDWTTYGEVTCHCGSDTNTYTVLNPGEVCNTCLQLYISSSMNDICVDGVAKVTISTNQSHSHGDAITLYANNSVCSSFSNANDVVTCRELSNVVGHTLSYNITAVDVGTVMIRGQTSYYGATWYSNLETITIVEECDEDVPSNITATSSVNTTDVPQTAAPSSDDDIINNNDSISSKEVPTNSTSDGSSGDTVLDQPTTKVNITGDKEDDESPATMIAIICMSAFIVVVTLIIILAIVIYFYWKYQKEKTSNKEVQIQNDQQPMSLINNFPENITEEFSC